MKKITYQDYENAVNFILDFEKNLPEKLKPEIIIHNGHINNPGVSDLDIIFVFRDDFLFCSYFLELFNNHILKLENHDTFFHHEPFIYPLSTIKDLPSMSLNPVSELQILKGNINFTKNDIDYYQNILNSFEQIHSRISTLIMAYLSKIKNLHSLLLIGHSMLHSIHSINQLGLNLKKNDFKTFIKIEDLRKKITNEGIYNDENYFELCLGIIDEFYLLLEFLNKIIEDKILIHFSKNHNIHKYSNDTYLINLNKKKDKINFNLKNNNIFIEGFSWQTMCLFENYFLDSSSFQTVFNDSEFEFEIKKRIDFLKKIFIFNFNNFNDPVGRSSFYPLVRGVYLKLLSRKMIQ